MVLLRQSDFFTEMRGNNVIEKTIHDTIEPETPNLYYYY